MLGCTAANNWWTLVKHTPQPINPSLECHSYPENQRHLRNAELLFFSKKEKTAPLILCSLHMLGERLKGPKKPPRMQTICHLAQKLSNFNSASGICCICLCPALKEFCWGCLEDSQLQVDCISITARGTEGPGQWQKSKANGDDHKSAPGRAEQRECGGVQQQQGRLHCWC